MKSLFAAFLCLASFPLAIGPARAADDDSAAAMLKTRLEIRTKANQITQEGSKAIAVLQTKQGLMYQLINAAQGKPPAPAQVEELKTQAETLRLQLAAVQRQLELAEITDPAARAEQVKKLEAARVKVDEQLYEANAPTKKKIDELNAPLRKADAAFAAALDKYFKAGTGNFASKRGKLSWASNETGQLSWTGDDGKQVVWISLFLQDRNKSNFPSPQIDGKYRVSGLSPGGTNPNIWISLGNFNVCINVNKAEWGRDQATLFELAKNLIDLEGLDSLGKP